MEVIISILPSFKLLLRNHADDQKIAFQLLMDIYSSTYYKTNSTYFYIYSLVSIIKDFEIASRCSSSIVKLLYQAGSGKY
jgi:hypothetical protein